MNATTTLPPAGPPRSFAERWADVLTCPGDLFASLRRAPVSASNWLLPLLLTIALAAMSYSARVPHTAAPLQKLNALVFIALAGVAGLLWSSLLLWAMGRLLFKAEFPFSKALEVAGLAQVVTALSLVITHLLIEATGNPFARPALSLLVPAFDPGNRLHVVLGTINFMHFWTAGVLAMGLARLSQVPFSDAAFWVVGYWIGLRFVLASLGAGAMVL